jgi:hypothetical protein
MITYKIRVKEKFIHGGQVFEAGEEHHVDLATYEYLATTNWVEGLDGDNQAILQAALTVINPLTVVEGAI